MSRDGPSGVDRGGSPAVDRGGSPAVDRGGSAANPEKQIASTRETDRRDARLSGLDRWVHALFARHADDRRHDADRRRYRGCDPSTGFETYLARTYALSWVVGVVVLLTTVAVGQAALPDTAATAEATFVESNPVLPVGITDVPGPVFVGGVALAAGLCAKRATIAGGGLYLRWLVSARRTRIERTLPGAVRYLDALSSGSDDARTMLAKVAANDAYGGTATSFRKVLNAARLTGSLDTGLGRVARDTPSRDLLAPFLLKFRQHVSQGDEALAEFLGTESRLLAHRQEHARTRARRYLKPLAELFVLVLVLPALLVIAVTVASVFAPALLRLIDTPVGAVSPRAVAVYVSIGFLLVVGAIGIAAIGALRPIDSRRRYRHPGTIRGVIATAPSNPASVSVLALIPAAAVAGWLAYAGYTLVNVSLLSYVVFAVPVGLVAARRDRIDDAKDRRIAEFVYAVSEHASVGRPFPEAVATVADEADLGVLRADVADLAFDLSLTTTAEREGVEPGSAAASTSPDAPTTQGDVRAAALDRFVNRVGTPLAERTIGIVSGALNAGSTVDDVFETLRVEVDRLSHEKRALRSAMRRYVAVGWVAAVAVAGIVAAINAHVMETDRLVALASALDASFDPDLFYPELERFRLYAVAQATMLASGWFAGAAARGRYGALLHSGVLVACCYAGFTLGGLV